MSDSGPAPRDVPLSSNDTEAKQRVTEIRKETNEDVTIILRRSFVLAVTDIVTRQDRVRSVEQDIKRMDRELAELLTTMEIKDAEIRQQWKDSLPPEKEISLLENWSTVRELIEKEEAEKGNWQKFVDEESLKLRQASVDVVHAIAKVATTPAAIETSRKQSSASHTQDSRVSEAVDELDQILKAENTGHLVKKAVSPEVERGKEIIIELHRATDHLEELQDEFDRRQDRYEYDLARFQDSVDAGLNNASLSDFDRAHILYVGDLTRELIEAETSMEDALAVAREHGLMGHQSKELDDQSNGGSIIGSGHEIKPESYSQVATWVDEVTNAGTDSPIEPQSTCAEWDAESLGFGESLSTYAEGAERKDIDRWRSQCENLVENV
jgi:phage host-nuclease inhibitor protein Gam